MWSPMRLITKCGSPFLEQMDASASATLPHALAAGAEIIMQEREMTTTAS